MSYNLNIYIRNGAAISSFNLLNVELNFVD